MGRRRGARWGPEGEETRPGMEAGTPGERTSAALPAAACDRLLRPQPGGSLGRQGPVPAQLGADLEGRSPEPAAGGWRQSELNRCGSQAVRETASPPSVVQNRGGRRGGPRVCRTPARPPRSQEPRGSEPTTGLQVRPFRAPPRGRRRPQPLPQGPEAGHFGAKPARRARINRVDSIKWIFPDLPPC